MRVWRTVVILLTLSAMKVSANTGVVKLCGVEWPPFTYRSFENPAVIDKGITYEIYTEAFRRLGLSFTTTILPWPRCLAATNKGLYDGIIDNADMPPFISGNHPTGVYSLAIFVKQDHPEMAFNWASMEGKTVGMVRGYSYTPKIKAFDGWVKQLAPNEEQLLRMLKGQRHNYVLLDIFSADILASKVGVDIKQLKPIVDSIHLHLTFSPENNAIAEQFDQTIKQMIDDGTIDNIYQKFLPYSYQELMDNYQIE